MRLAPKREVWMAMGFKNIEMKEYKRFAVLYMPTINKKSIRPPWLPEPKPYERIRHRNQHIYNDRKWRGVSEAFKAANPVCMLCGVEPSYYTDHIHPINEGGKVWDKSNWQAICVSCNAKKTGKQRKG